MHYKSVSQRVDEAITAILADEAYLIILGNSGTLFRKTSIGVERIRLTPRVTLGILQYVSAPKPGLEGAIIIDRGAIMGYG